MQNNTKSSAVAGLLGVFLGFAGGHDWYLGNTKKAITHVSLTVGGLLLLMVGIILKSLTDGVVVINVLFICMIIAAYIIIIGNAVWGFIEGVIIIAQGDAGLAAKGYKVADPASTTMTLTNPSTGEPNVASAASATSNAGTNTAEAAKESEKPTEPPIEPAHLDNIITAAPAEGSVMQATVPTTATSGAANVVPEVATTGMTAASAPVASAAPVAQTTAAEVVGASEPKPEAPAQTVSTDGVSSETSAQAVDANEAKAEVSTQPAVVNESKPENLAQSAPTTPAQSVSASGDNSGNEPKPEASAQTTPPVSPFA